MNKFKKIFCAIFRHSKIGYMFFGYQYCGRCGEQIGDTLASVGNRDIVFLSHRKTGGYRYKDGTPAEDCKCAKTKLTFIDWFLIDRKRCNES